MLNTMPPGYSPSSINQQSNQLLGTPGILGAGVKGQGTTGGFGSGMSALSSNPLTGQNMQMMMQALMARGGR